MTEWVSVQDRMPKESTIVKVRRKDESEERAYFHHDKMCWLIFYGLETTHWQSMDLEWLKDVTHWKEEK